MRNKRARLPRHRPGLTNVRRVLEVRERREIPLPSYREDFGWGCLQVEDSWRYLRDVSGLLVLAGQVSYNPEAGGRECRRSARCEDAGGE
jgi:hypothetical protein